jgi:Pvc16 N-terminal domain
MSNHLAIATITATIQRTLQSSVQLDVEGARITTVQPGEIGKGTPETGVNLFLYHVITNPALNNLDAISSRSRGNPIRRQVALDLYYMVSFYGNESELEPQRLLGSVVRTLNDKRVFQPEMIRDTCRDVTFSYLQPSTLAEQLQQISISPLDLNLEDLSKAWSVFFQAPYLLSVAYKVLVVLIEGEESSTRALPVRGRMGGLVAFPNTPQVDKIMGQGGLYDPILATSTLLIQGKYLKGDRHTQVRIGGVEVTPTGIKDNELLLPLSLVPEDLLRAGVQSLQVIQCGSFCAQTTGHSGGARGDHRSGGWHSCDGIEGDAQFPSSSGSTGDCSLE